MFRSWRSERKRIKTTFKLQFQATQVPQLKKPALIISLVPEDVGKTTFKLEKTPVQDGTCSWENPIYVTVKLVKEPKSGKLHEKIYHFIVSSGSSKSGYLGEASIDFADFAEENEPLTVSLPLKFANSGALLHVTIQRIQGGAEQRKTEGHEGFALVQDGSLNNQLNGCHTDGNNTSFAEDRNADICSFQDARQDGSFKSSIDSTSCQSTPRGNSVPKGAVDTVTSNRSLHRRSSTDWSMGSVSDGSLVDSTNSPEHKLPRELEEASDGSEKLKNEISCLLRQAELSDIELQSLRKQIMKENKRGQDLSRQIIELKEERDGLRAECEHLKSSLKYFEGEEVLHQLRAENEESRVLLEEIKRELSHEKELNTNLKLQLQKTQDSNSELILAVGDLDEMLKHKNMEISSLSAKIELSKNTIDAEATMSEFKVKEDHQVLPLQEESTMGQNDASELYLLKQKITDLSDEIELSRENRESLEKYIEQLTQDYEDLKRVNHDISSKLEHKKLQEVQTQSDLLESLANIEELESQVRTLEENLNKQTQEFSESLVCIKELENQVKKLEKEMEKQAQGFENDLESMTRSKIEQEQRAIRAEEALRKTRWKNAMTAERLQEDFKRLSVEMAGRFDEKEKLATNALTEVNELREQNRVLQENMQKAKEKLFLIEEQNREKANELLIQLDMKTKQNEQLSLELEDKSKQLIYAKQQEGKMQEEFSEEVHKLKAKIEALDQKQNDESDDTKEEANLGDRMGQSKTSFEETKMLIEKLKKERDEMEEKFAVVKKDGEKTLEELQILRSVKEEKEKMVENVLSQVQDLQSQLIKLRQSLSEEELEKENLQKQVYQLKSELQAKEEESTIGMKKHKNNKAKEAQFSNAGEILLRPGMSTEVERKVTVAPCERDEYGTGGLLTEMALLKERNKAMESELKEMEERYSEISLKFAEVEGERQTLVMTVRNLKNGKRN